MSLVERAIYRDLLDFCWRDGSIPADKRVLTQMLAVSPEMILKEWRQSSGGVSDEFQESSSADSKLSRVWWYRRIDRVLQKFRLVDGRYYHHKVDERRNSLIGYHKSRSEAGRKGGLKSGAVRSLASSSASSTASSKNEAVLKPSPSPSPSPSEQAYSTEVLQPVENADGPTWNGTRPAWLALLPPPTITLPGGGRTEPNPLFVRIRDKLLEAERSGRAARARNPGLYMRKIIEDELAKTSE